jgi:hypothetical protein
MYGDDRVETGALPATYEQLFVVELLEVAVDQLLVTVNTAALPEPPETRFESLDEPVPEPLPAPEPPDAVELDAAPVPPDAPVAAVELVVPELPGPAVPVAARSVVVPVAPGAAGLVAAPDVEPGSVVAEEEDVVGAVPPGVAGAPVLVEEVLGSLEL